jgi:hypothetical protein
MLSNYPRAKQQLKPIIINAVCAFYPTYFGVEESKSTLVILLITSVSLLQLYVDF